MTHLRTQAFALANDTCGVGSDKDGDQTVSLQEFTAFVDGVAVKAHKQRLPKKIVNEAFHYIDIDGSNSIEREEFERFLEVFHKGNINTLDL